MKGWSDALSRITSSAPPLSSTTGAELSERRVDLESQVEELEILEREIKERRERVEKLGPTYEKPAVSGGRSFPRGARGACGATRAEELREQIVKVATAEAEVREQERLHDQRGERLRAEQLRLSDRERSLDDGDDWLFDEEKPARTSASSGASGASARSSRSCRSAPPTSRHASRRSSGAR